jgi:hypothetical protein
MNYIKREQQFEKAKGRVFFTSERIMNQFETPRGNPVFCWDFRLNLIFKGFGTSD